MTGARRFPDARPNPWQRQREVFAMIIGGAVVLAGCVFFVWIVGEYTTAKVNASELYGTYIATFSDGSETLTLRSDGTFLQEVHPGGAPVINNSGTWTLLPSQRGIEMHDCLWTTNHSFGVINDPHRTVGLPSAGPCTLEVHRRWVIGQLNIEVGDEDLAPYWKVN